MGSETVISLHILFFPYLAPGHMIPMVDLAKLFSKRGVKSTIVTTPANAAAIQSSINTTNESSQIPISIALVHFPSPIPGLPQGCENAHSISSVSLRGRLLSAVALLRQPFDEVLRELRPDCVIADGFLPWTVDVASELGIPALFFHLSGFFPHCASDAVRRYKPHENLPAGEDIFILPGLPGKISMLKSQIPDISTFGPPYPELFKQIGIAEARCYGVLVNSFRELEPKYVDHYQNVMGHRWAWAVGPVSLCTDDIMEKAERSGVKSSINVDECLNWLDNRTPSSVLYVCFGSMTEFSPAQLRELAVALETSVSHFIWVVTKNSELPEGYEEKVKQSGRGLIIRGWAPQTLILSHAAVGCFMTHCGWNSTIECISSGVPMVTWPLMAEQFYNERLVVDVLKIGCSVGNKEYVVRQEERKVVPAAEISRAVARVMGGGEEAEEMREKAKVLGKMAKKAVDAGGSSYLDISNFIQQLLKRRGAA